MRYAEGGSTQLNVTAGKPGGGAQSTQRLEDPDEYNNQALGLSMVDHHHQLLYIQYHSPFPGGNSVGGAHASGGLCPPRVGGLGGARAPEGSERGE